MKDAKGLSTKVAFAVAAIDELDRKKQITLAKMIADTKDPLKDAFKMYQRDYKQLQSLLNLVIVGHTLTDKDKLKARKAAKNIIEFLES